MDGDPGRRLDLRGGFRLKEGPDRLTSPYHQCLPRNNHPRGRCAIDNARRILATARTSGRPSATHPLPGGRFARGEMSRRRYPPAFKAEVIAARALGEPTIEIARRTGLSQTTIDRWYATEGPRQGNRTSDDLGELVFAVVCQSLRAISARAIETARPEWIREQSAEALARLDEVTWNQIVRIVASFRPVRDGSDGSAADGDQAEDRPAFGDSDGSGSNGYRDGRAGRNGALDPAV